MCQERGERQEKRVSWSRALPPPMSPRPLNTTPPTINQRDRCQDPVWLVKGTGGHPGPGQLRETSCFLSLTSDSSKYTQRVILCRIMLLAYSSCLHSKEVRSLRSSPESRPCRSRSIARPRQPPEPSSGCGLTTDERMGLGSRGEGPGEQGSLAFSEEKPSCPRQDHFVQLNRVCTAQGHHI